MNFAPVPNSPFLHKGVRHSVLEVRNNVWYRALVLPYGGGCPVWLTNAEVAQVNEELNHEQ